MLSPDGYVSTRKIEGLTVQVLYDRSYAVYKIATSLVEPLMIGGYSSQELRDTLVGLVEDAIVQKRPTIRFENGKAIHLEEYYLQHASASVEHETAIPLDSPDDIVAGEVLMPSDVAAGLVSDFVNAESGEALADRTPAGDETHPHIASYLASDLTHPSIAPRENLLETGGAGEPAKSTAAATRKGAKK